MTNEQKSRFIVEKVLGECWHEWVSIDGVLGGRFVCVSTCLDKAHVLSFSRPKDNPDFYSTDPDEQAINFFKLWRTLGEKGVRHDGYTFTVSADKPASTLADAVVEYMKGGEDAE